MKILVSKNEIYLTEILNKYITVDHLKDFCEYYENFECDVIQGDSLSHKSNFSINICILKEQNGGFTPVKLTVKNALFTDRTGYCHKIPIEKNIILEPNY